VGCPNHWFKYPSTLHQAFCTRIPSPLAKPPTNMRLSNAFASLLSLVSLVAAQQVGTLTAENHPSLSWQKCTKSGGCSSQAGSVTLDSNWRWLHTTSGYTNCFTGASFDTSLCPDGVTCAKNCALDGADYSGTYGITTSGNALTLKFKTGTNVGKRLELSDVQAQEPRVHFRR
jgi:cellulose 1,4-beta-cellobiosidase